MRSHHAAPASIYLPGGVPDVDSAKSVRSARAVVARPRGACRSSTLSKKTSGTSNVSSKGGLDKGRTTHLTETVHLKRLGSNVKQGGPRKNQGALLLLRARNGSDHGLYGIPWSQEHKVGNEGLNHSRTGRQWVVRELGSLARGCYKGYDCHHELGGGGGQVSRPDGRKLFS